MFKVSSPLYNGSFTSHLTDDTKITSHSRTQTGNIFSNSFDNEISSGNTTPTTSDHVAQFFLTRKNSTQRKNKETSKY